MRNNVLYSGLCAAVLLAAGAFADDLSDIRDRRFRERDSNRDGYLSVEEYGGHPGNFRALDQNRDGRLSRDEFVYRSRSVPDEDFGTPSGNRSSELDDFTRMDRNHNGVISRNEWDGDFRN